MLTSRLAVSLADRPLRRVVVPDTAAIELSASDTACLILCRRRTIREDRCAPNTADVGLSISNTFIYLSATDIAHNVSRGLQKTSTRLPRMAPWPHPSAESFLVLI